LLFRGVLVHGDGFGAGALSRSHRGGTAVGPGFLGGRLGGSLGWNLDGYESHRVDACHKTGRRAKCQNDH
jgi:hypothetical protein